MFFGYRLPSRPRKMMMLNSQSSKELSLGNDQIFRSNKGYDAKKRRIAKCDTADSLEEGGVEAY
jgi:hypothetical protein